MSRLKASWLTLLTMGGLLSAPGFADDVVYANLDDELREETPSTKALFAEFKYAPQPQSQIDAMTNYGQESRTIVDFDPDDDAGVLARLGKARSLSLLTVAETDQARLFFGVNGDGVLGLHFRALPRRIADQHLEFMRMPYLENNERTREFSHPEMNPD